MNKECDLANEAVKIEDKKNGEVGSGGEKPEGKSTSIEPKIKIFVEKLGGGGFEVELVFVDGAIESVEETVKKVTDERSGDVKNQRSNESNEGDSDKSEGFFYFFGHIEGVID